MLRDIGVTGQRTDGPRTARGTTRKHDAPRLIIIIIIIHTILYRCKVVTSEAVAKEIRSRQSLSVIMSHVEQVSFAGGGIKIWKSGFRYSGIP